MSGEHNVAALLQQENADLRGHVGDLAAELKRTNGDLAVAVDEATSARAAIRSLRDEVATQRALRSDGIRIATGHIDSIARERDALAETLRAARDYVETAWGRAEQAAEQVRRVPAAGVAQAFADLAEILGSDRDGDG